MYWRASCKQAMGYEYSVHNQPWPSYDEAQLVEDTVTIVVQVNGKLRGHMEVSANASRAEIEAAALHHDAVLRFGGGQKPKKVIVVPGRLVNVVV